MPLAATSPSSLSGRVFQTAWGDSPSDHCRHSLLSTVPHHAAMRASFARRRPAAAATFGGTRGLGQPGHLGASSSFPSLSAESDAFFVTAPTVTGLQSGEGRLRVFDAQLAREFERSRGSTARLVAGGPRARRERFEVTAPRGLQQPRCSSAPSGEASLSKTSVTLRGEGGEEGMGLTLIAQRENFKKERYMQEAERGSELERSNAGATSEAVEGGEEAATAILAPEVIAEDFRNVEHQIEEYYKSVRLEHLESGAQDERRRAERERERRLLEEAARRARMKEKEARDPKRKIKMRLENKRAGFQSDTPGPCVPMYRVDVKTAAGASEHVSLVDVHMLRSMARGLEAGDGVDELLKKVKAQDREERRRASSSPASQSRSTTFGVKSHGARRERALAQKEEIFVTELFRKMSLMRGNGGANLPFRFMLEEADGLRTYDSEHDSEDVSQRMKLRLGPPAALMPIAMKSEVYGAYERDETRKSLMGRAICARVQEVEKGASQGRKSKFKRSSALQQLVGAFGGQVEAAEDDLSAMHEEEEELSRIEAAKKAASARSRRRWAVVRASSMLVLLLLRLRRASTSALVIVSFLHQLGSWARIKTSMRRLATGVKLIQREGRSYVSLKRRRCDIMEIKWQDIEDRELQAAFKALVQMAVEEKCETLDTPGVKRELKRMVAGKLDRRLNTKYRGGNVDSMDKADSFEFYQRLRADREKLVDWRSFRLPVDKRRLLLNKWYVFHLRKHVQAQMALQNLIRQVVESERDLVSFLQSFTGGHFKGAPDVSLMSTKIAPSLGTWWIYDDDTFLTLITAGIQSLADTEPFNDHPFFREELQAISQPLRVAKARGSSRNIFLERAERARIKGAKGSDVNFKKGGPDRASSVAESIVMPATEQHYDVEELFRGFTPRLRDICEKQAGDYEHASKRSADASDASVVDSPPGDVLAAVKAHET